MRWIGRQCRSIYRTERPQPRGGHVAKPPRARLACARLQIDQWHLYILLFLSLPCSARWVSHSVLRPQRVPFLLLSRAAVLPFLSLSLSAANRGRIRHGKKSQEQKKKTPFSFCIQRLLSFFLLEGIQSAQAGMVIQIAKHQHSKEQKRTKHLGEFFIYFRVSHPCPGKKGTRTKSATTPTIFCVQNP